jgi:hypothetical protein
MATKGNTDWRAMQVPPHRSKEQGTRWLRPGDTNVRAMSMGSWRCRTGKLAKKQGKS